MVNDKESLPSDGKVSLPPQIHRQDSESVPGGFDFASSQTHDQGDGQFEEVTLQDAVMSIPDADAMSVSSLHTTSTDRAADEQTAAVAESEVETGPFTTPKPNTATNVDDEIQNLSLDDTQHQLDWNHVLGLSGQGINAANTATSMGFAAARQTTSFSLLVAKRFTQGLLALPAMALDGTLFGNAPSRDNYSTNTAENGSIAQITHAAVGGLFDVISALAIGGIDIGTAITGAGLGAAASGVEGVRRALGSEVLRSLGAFSRLVRREWNSASDSLPPGGIPQYSILGITQALTSWVCIQMVTREYYEKKMLRNLEVVDLKSVHQSIQAAKEKREKEEAELQDQTFVTAFEENEVTKTEEKKRERKNTLKKKKKQVRILDDEELPGDEGDVIDAEIGDATDALSALRESSIKEAEPSTTAQSLPSPLSDEDAISGLKRYSRLVLGVYGGVALAWLGSLPPDLMQAAGSVVDGEAATVPKPESTSLPNPSSGADTQQPLITGRSRGRSAAQDDAADFLRAAASLDLEEDELVEDEASSIITPPAEISRSATPRPLDPKLTTTTATRGEVIFSAEEDDAPAATSSTPRPPAKSYSYYDILMGTADTDIFHRLGGLEQGLATEGDYNETASQAGSAAERLRRLQNPVARPSKPRYYVVTDHTQRKIVLVLRGSLSLGDIAIDLTCESANFDMSGLEGDVKEHDERSQSSRSDSTTSDMPVAAEDFSPEAIRERAEQKVQDAQERRSKSQSRVHERSEYIVHEGMYETAKEIGEIGRPVHRAVRRALLAHPEYALDITGHSLGAGVAALLAIMWASPETGLTSKRSGLPVGRKTHAYCFAVPCVMGAKLGKRSESLVTSYCYSYDLVCRLSLGAILDIRNACAWLAYENSQPSAINNNGQSTANDSIGLAKPLRMTNIMQRAFVHQSGRATGQTKIELEADFLALRKTLEASMPHVELYPPGLIFYSLSASDIEDGLQSEQAQEQVNERLQSTRLAGGLSTNSSYSAAQKAVLYKLKSDGQREEVFGQIIHSRGMLSGHMPHIYHAAIDAL